MSGSEIISLKDCKENNLGKCKSLFTCGNNVSILIDYKKTTAGLSDFCTSDINESKIIIDKNKKVILSYK